MGAREIGYNETGLHLFRDIQETIRKGEFNVEKFYEQRYGGDTKFIFLKESKETHKNTPKIGGKLRRTNMEVLENTLEERMYREAKTILERGYEEANLLRNLGVIPSVHVWAPIMHTLREAESSRKDTHEMRGELTMTYVV